MSGTLTAMTGSKHQFGDLLAGLRSGDPAVLTGFFHRYAPALERLASSRLQPALGRRVGPASIAQSVCRTFMRRAGRGEYEILNSDDLWALLCAIAITKVREQVRFHGRMRRNIGREAGLEQAVSVPAGESPPDEQVLFEDSFRTAMEELSGAERQIVELRLAGETQVAIAETLGRSERTVRRIMTALEARLIEALS
jgi:RNA polymerase sigma factor (sigma-70 family)